ASSIPCPCRGTLLHASTPGKESRAAIRAGAFVGAVPRSFHRAAGQCACTRFGTKRQGTPGGVTGGCHRLGVATERGQAWQAGEGSPTGIRWIYKLFSASRFARSAVATYS